MMGEDERGGGGQNAVENGVKILASGSADKVDVTVGRLSTTYPRQAGFISVWTSGNVCRDGSPDDGKLVVLGDDMSSEVGLLKSTGGSAESDPTCNMGAVSKLSSNEVPASTGVDSTEVTSGVR